tara:strand:- start:108 stop:1070 length:963 start_codon:yes stop_codon:yes gene_type:complete
MLNRIFIIYICLVSFILSKEIHIKEITLQGLITNPKQEISGMDWYNDYLFLLPENLGGFLFMIPKNQIQNAIDSRNAAPLQPQKTDFITPNYSISIPGFDGLEAIAFFNNNVLISIEAEHKGTMSGYVAWGSFDPKTLQIIIPEENIKKINTPSQIDNMSFESILVNNNEAIMIYEANGANIQKKVTQPVLSLSDFTLRKIRAPNIEYRITDVTKISKNKFWAINYYWSGDKKKLIPAKDKISKKYPKKESHRKVETVERLIEFEIKKDKIRLSKNAPIQLYLENGAARNWEAICRFNKNGFLIATDKYPRMILGYIKVP